MLNMYDQHDQKPYMCQGKLFLKKDSNRRLGTNYYRYPAGNEVRVKCFSESESFQTYDIQGGYKYVYANVFQKLLKEKATTQ